MEPEAPAALFDHSGHPQAPDAAHTGGEHEVLIWLKDDWSNTFNATDSLCIHHSALHPDLHNQKPET